MQDTNSLTPPPAAPSTTRPSLWSRLGPAGILGAAWVAFPPLCSIGLFTYSKTISEWFRSHGLVEGLALFIAAFVVLAGLGLLPTYAQAILAGFAFGPVWGFIAALVGFTGASIVGYTIARVVSRKSVEEVIEEHPKAKAIADSLIHESKAKTFMVTALLRLPPNSPFALTNLLMASVRIPPVTFVLATIIGMSPRTLVATYFGSHLNEWTGQEKPPWWVVAGGIAMTVLVMGVIGAIASRALKKLANGGGAGSGGVGVRDQTV